ncbi:hypothetical protein NP493_85g05049 [Ridgeia piscesae]|uniref:Uncharacterized protein n=1 Tax=Ridgeia piscesae TaxID=27915 RepID=A0AAD9UI68_RIDPI|nr:hypothetical protein NP493_85g05049 [Ridgeia piscesae]
MGRKRTPPFLLELAPEPPQNTPDPTAPTRVNSGRSSMSKPSSARSARSAASQTDQPPVYPYINRSDTCDDLSFLPRPKMIVSRDNPWVFRYKVKKNMNELSKIMASRPPPPPAPSLAE